MIQRSRLSTEIEQQRGSKKAMSDTVTNMVRILYIVSTLKRSGPVRVLLNLVSNIERERLYPIILTLSGEEKDSMLSELQSANIRVESLSLTRSRSLLRGRNILRSLIGKLNPSIIHSHGLRADSLMAGICCKSERICTLHAYPNHEYPMKFGRIKGTLIAKQHIRALKHLDTVIACSKSIAEQVQSHHQFHTDVIQNGIDDSVFAPCTCSERRSLRNRLGLPCDRKILISVGALIARKDPETVLRAFLASRLSDKGMLVILGKGDLIATCEGLAADHQNVRFVGQVPNVVDYLNAADAFVSASRAEGLPNTVLEALACGLPICVSDIPEHQEILACDARVGRTFPVGCHEALAQTLNALDATDVRVPSELSVDLVRLNFSAKTMAQKYQRLYDEFLSKSGRSMN